jgi:soluble lytic murein transglycosylase-like protein
MVASYAAIVRWIVAAAVAFVSADALITVVRSPPRSTESAPLAAAGLGENGELAARSQWVVKIDGWTLRLDDVDAGYWAAVLRELDAESGERPDPGTAQYPYLDLIMRTASAEGIDWRLIVAVIAEESAFDARAESPAGAYGLMQVRAIAAREVEAERYRTPAANVRTGVRYLKRMMNLFPSADAFQGLALALAAYNMGPAHLADAQSLARRYGVDPMRWDDALERVLPLLEEPLVYPRLPNGFARGRTTVAYVERVRRRFDRLRRQHPLAPVAAATS